MKPASEHIPATVASHTSAAVTLLAMLVCLTPVLSFAQLVPADSAAAQPVTSIRIPAHTLEDDSLTPSQIRKRTRLVAGANIAGYGAIMAGLYSTWYKKYPQTHFHSFNDAAEWKQIDKIGHAYSAYAAGKASMEMWRWTGIDRKKRIWIGGMSGAAWQTIIETLDAFSAEWGWSWSDIGANLIGSGLLVSQELAWDEQRIQFKFSFHPKRYTDPALQQRNREIFGTSGFERLFKDYNGQTYWLSTGVRTLFPHSRLPAWLQVSIGTGAEGMFGARSNTGKDKAGNIIFDRPDIPRYRQWYLAPDIDLTKIPTRKKGLRFALRMLNVFKFPAPALEYSNGSFKLRAISF